MQEPVVIDEFKKHKTLGELILIDRISNMTSACGVVEDAAVDESKDLKAAFVYGSLKEMETFSKSSIITLRV